MVIKNLNNQIYHKRAFLFIFWIEGGRHIQIMTNSINFMIGLFISFIYIWRNKSFFVWRAFVDTKPTHNSLVQLALDHLLFLLLPFSFLFVPFAVSDIIWCVLQDERLCNLMKYFGKIFFWFYTCGNFPAIQPLSSKWKYSYQNKKCRNVILVPK